MTRINTVHPSHLSNKHLQAEYKEITRIGTNVLELYSKGKTLADVDIPENFKLNKGHMKFFYNKMAWIYERYIALHIELAKRKVNVDHKLHVTITKNWLRNVPNECWNNWVPSPEDHYLSMARLCKRSKMENVLDELTS